MYSRSYLHSQLHAEDPRELLLCVRALASIIRFYLRVYHIRLFGTKIAFTFVYPHISRDFRHRFFFPSPLIRDDLGKIL